MSSIEPKDFEDFGLYKFVRFDNGKVLFCSAIILWINHQTLVLENPEMKPVSSGKIRVTNGGWNIVERGSFTAKLHGLEDDQEVVEKNIGDVLVYDEDIMPW